MITRANMNTLKTGQKIYANFYINSRLEFLEELVVEKIDIKEGIRCEYDSFLPPEYKIITKNANNEVIEFDPGGIINPVYCYENKEEARTAALLSIEIEIRVLKDRVKNAEERLKKIQEC